MSDELMLVKIITTRILCFIFIWLDCREKIAVNQLSVCVRNKQSTRRDHHEKNCYHLHLFNNERSLNITLIGPLGEMRNL